MKITAFFIPLFLLTFSMGLAQEKPANDQEIKNSMNQLLAEVEQDMLTLLEAEDPNNIAIYYLDKTRNRLRHKLDSLSLLDKPDRLSLIIHLNTERSRLLKSSSPSNPIIQNLDTQIAKLKAQME